MAGGGRGARGVLVQVVTPASSCWKQPLRADPPAARAPHLKVVTRESVCFGSNTETDVRGRRWEKLPVPSLGWAPGKSIADTLAGCSC